MQTYVMKQIINRMFFNHLLSVRQTPVMSFTDDATSKVCENSIHNKILHHREIGYSDELHQMYTFILLFLEK